MQQVVVQVNRVPARRVYGVHPAAANERILPMSLSSPDQPSGQPPWEQQNPRQYPPQPPSYQQAVLPPDGGGPSYPPSPPSSQQPYRAPVPGWQHPPRPAGLTAAERFWYILGCIPYGAMYFAKIPGKKAMADFGLVGLTGWESFWYILMCIPFGAGYFAKIPVAKALSELPQFRYGEFPRLATQGGYPPQ
jgi:hypothetical protein